MSWKPGVECVFLLPLSQEGNKYSWLGSLYSLQNMVMVMVSKYLQFTLQNSLSLTQGNLCGKGEHWCQQLKNQAAIFPFFRCYCTIWWALASRFHRGIAIGFLLLRSLYRESLTHQLLERTGAHPLELIYSSTPLGRNYALTSCSQLSSLPVVDI